MATQKEIDTISNAVKFLREIVAGENTANHPGAYQASIADKDFAVVFRKYGATLKRVGDCETPGLCELILGCQDQKDLIDLLAGCETEESKTKREQLAKNGIEISID